MHGRSDAQTPEPAFLAGGGEMGALVRAHDWAATPLGSPENWPQALRSAVQICLHTPIVAAVHWGPDLRTLYNDAYAPALAERHPWALGRPFDEVWAEIWDVLGPQIASVMETGRGFSTDHQLLRMNRNGRLEDTFWVYSFAPLHDGGKVAGVFVTALDTTDKVVAERRLTEAQEHQRKMLRQMPGFVGMLSGPDLVYTYVNDAYVAISERMDFIGRRFRDVFADIEGQGFHELFENVFHTGNGVVTRGMELRLHGREDKQYVDFVLEPIRDDDGAVTGVFVGGYETTEVYRGNEALRASEARLAFLDRLGAATAPLADADAVLSTTTRLLGEHLNLSVCAYADMDEDEDGFTIRGDWAAPGSTSIVGHYSLADFGRLAVKNLSAGLPLVVHDNLKELAPNEAATFQSIGIAATICMPLVKEGRLTALMAIHNRVPRMWAEAELGLLREVTARSWAHVERVATMAALGGSEERLRLAVDNADVGFWDVDVANDRLIWPPRTKAMFGISADVPVTMQDFYDGLHSDDREATSEAYAAAADPARRALYDVEYRTIGKEDGIVRWIAAKGRGVFDETGRCLRVTGTAIDVSRRKAAEAGLRESEARLRELNETLESQVAARTAERDRIWNLPRDLMCVARTDGMLIAVNPAWERLLGWSTEWLTGRNASEIKHPEDAARTATELERLADGHPTLGFEDRYRKKDGGWLWLSWTIEPEGDLIYCIGRDVTAEKTRQAELQAAEDARRRADALYRAYFENTAEALFVVAVLPDGGFVIDDLNPAHQASIGLPLAEVAGRRIDEVLPPELAETVSSYYRHVLETGEVYQYRETFQIRGGATYWDTVLVPVRDVEGRIVRLIGASRDLTGQLAAEDALRQSQKMEAMGQLTGGVAHDFNNLLTPIIGSLDMLTRRGVGSERERRLIDGALQSAERAKTLVQRLLAFARRQPLQPTAIDVRELVGGMAELIASTSGPTVDVRLALPDNLPPAVADANQLEMAVLNLAVNARDAMPHGGVLTISAARESIRSGHRSKLRQGHYVRLSVKDTGIGMDEATLARAIEPFFSTKGIGKGTGLGLSMVHGLAAQLGGGLTIESTPSQGTTVELWLPISARPIGEDEAEALEAPARVGRGTALLVDDEELVRMSTADMLMDLGFEVAEASSAEEALRLLQAGRAPDLLVTDHLMPGMSGADLARAARELWPALPVLIVSGYSEVEGLAPDLPRLTKPFRNAELAASLSSLVPTVAK